jgi:glutamate--cysteine ligase
MQAIAGAHYNWSLPEAFWQILQETCSAAPLSMQAFISERYFGLIRNFLRFGWLIPYLFGASPALHASFLRGRKSNLQTLHTHTLYGPHATSLRMSDLGYRNRAQANLRVGFNTLAQYTQDLETALRTPDPFYQTIGVHEGAQRRQLNANLLQIENEFYASIRPKRISRERPAVALQKYGVQYVEVRLFDLHPLEDLGITPMQLDFADVLLLMCLFRESPPITSREQSENDENKNRVVNRGRQPDLHLVVHNREQPLQPLLHELFDDLLPFAEMLDAAYGDTRYCGCLQNLRERIDHPQSTPSAQVLEAVHSHGGFVEFAMHMANQHHQRWLAEPLDAPTLATFTAQAAQSLQAQAALEAQSQGSFEEYVARYYAQLAS